MSETFAIDLIEDIDLEKHELHIRRQMVKIQKTWYFKAPKYDSYRIEKLKCELSAWEQERNCHTDKIQWHFQTGDAREKLISLYPTLSTVTS